ncbi:hypothetical protein EJD97_023690 [Solanum chilense]|uniref:SWIM-type domain-containing protein n=1 Tax=Solanum chilense TaxID=4083 RepID=A0A6N2AVX3_SOLCI|nr:hypothetical protein EJD97_023690 [Solanum chilense]
MIEGNSLYVENVNGDNNQFTTFNACVTAYVDLLQKSCSCIEYDLIKIPCAHAMTALRQKHENEHEELLNVKIYPPLVDIKLGRKIRKRVKSIDENFKSKRRNKCSICKRTGHKRTTCVNKNTS